MKPLAKSILFTGALMIGATGLMAAPVGAGNSQFEEWHKAKYGRPSATEEARLKAEQANIAYREDTSVEVGSPANSWFEQWHKAKYGRFSPGEEARQRTAEENVAFREEPAPNAESQTDEWFQGWYRAKFGRTPPSHTAK